MQQGSTLGRYQILETLGEGGMATVYKAHQPALDRIVALKVIRTGFAEDREFIERFGREARAVARLTHPNIVQVYDFDQAEGRSFIAMQYLDGGTLKDRMGQLAQERRLLPQAEVARIIEQVAAGLGYAHGLGVVHRDIKPSNIMLTGDGRAVVADFGIARMLGGTQITATGVGIGTPEYMSPEQGQGGALGARSDVYSLGVVAYELLTGSLPFTADTPFALVLKHVRDPLPPPSEVNPAVGAATEDVLTKALAKEPADRYASATEFAEAVRLATATTEGRTLPTIRVQAKPSAPADALARFGRSNEIRQGIGALIALALLGVMYFDLLPRAAALDLSSVDLGTIATPAPTAAPTPRQVSFRPEQLIMPPEELHERLLAEMGIPGYTVKRDERGPGGEWRREFTPTGPSDFGSVEFRVNVLEPGRSVSPSCDRFTWTGEQPTSTRPVSAVTIGDRSVLCRFAFSGGTRWFVSWSADRNVAVEVYVLARAAATDDVAAVLAIRLAQTQVAIIERVSPR